MIDDLVKIYEWLRFVLSVFVVLASMKSVC